MSREIRENVVAGARLLRTVRATIARQAGVVSTAQLRAAGLSRSAIRHAVAAGRLFVLYPGVHAIVPPELLSRRGHLIAALLAGGRDALLSHQTAADHQLLIPAPPSTIHLTSPRCLIAPPGLTFHRCANLRATDVTTHDGLRSTSVPRTLLDLAVDYDRDPLLSALAEAEFRYDLRPEHVQATLRRGHPGSANLRAALDEHVPGYGKAKQRLERGFRSLLIRAKIELPDRNVVIGPYKVDSFWRHARLVAELDGRQHERPHQSGVDADRDLYLRRLDILVVRYTWCQVHDTPELVAEDVRDQLAKRS